MLFLCLHAAMISDISCGDSHNAQLFDTCPAETFSLFVPAADGVIHTAFLHDGSVPYLDAIKIDCAAIKAMTDAMAGTNKPFVQSSATGVMGTIKSAVLTLSLLLNTCTTRTSTERRICRSLSIPTMRWAGVQVTQALYL